MNAPKKRSGPSNQGGGYGPAISDVGSIDPGRVTRSIDEHLIQNISLTTRGRIERVDWLAVACARLGMNVTPQSQCDKTIF